MKEQKLDQIERMRRTALYRKTSAWLAYKDARRRFFDAYDTLLFAREDYNDASDDLGCDCDGEIRLKIASKRRKSAQEEFQYQMQEYKRVRAEFNAAQKEHRYWHKLAMVKMRRANEVMSN